MSSGQQSSIDISWEAPICMLEWTSPDDIATPAADAPTGSKAKEAAIANARMVRTNRIALYLPTFRSEARWDPQMYFIR